MATKTRKKPAVQKVRSSVPLPECARALETTRVVARTAGLAKEFKFGRVVVHAAGPLEAVERKNIAEGRTALSRAKSVLVRPGVQVQVKAGVPMYHADPAAPGFLLRTLDGRTTRGRFVGGKFKRA